MAANIAFKLSATTLLVPFFLSGGMGWAIYSDGQGHPARATEQVRPAGVGSSLPASLPIAAALVPAKPAQATVKPLDLAASMAALPPASAPRQRPAEAAVSPPLVETPEAPALPAPAPALIEREGVKVIRFALPAARPAEPEAPEPEARRPLDGAPAGFVAPPAVPAGLAEVSPVVPQVPASAAPEPSPLIAVASADLPAPVSEPVAPAPADIGVMPVDFDLVRDRPAPSPIVATAPAGAGSKPGAALKPTLARPTARTPKPLAAPAAQRSRTVGNRAYAVSPDAIDFAMPVTVGGKAASSIPVRVGTFNTISVKLQDLISVFGDDPAAAHLGAFAGAAAAQEYVSFEQIRAAGIDIRYDAAHDRITISVPD